MDGARTVDRYELLTELASGGMATVYLGRVRGAAGFARTVAIKRLHPHLASDRSFVAMFVDEGRLASRIRHPNVVPTLDIVSDGGELFLVMEYVHGEALSTIAHAARAAGAAIPMPVGAAIVSGMLLGLHAAHEATDEEGRPLDVVHRDVSPQNVLVGADGVTRLVDFGVSKAAGRLQSTGDGQLKGKLGYMPPESFRGTVDRRSDIYSTAVVLWEVVTGRRLFTGSHAEVLAKVLAGEVDPPSSIASDIPRAVDEVVLCGLEFTPDARFPTARAMERALRRAMPVASNFEVAEWLQRTMGSSLRERAARVAAIERDARVAVDASWLPVATGAQRVVTLGGRRAVDASDATGVATLQTVSARSSWSTRRWAWTGLSLTAAAGLATAVLLLRAPAGTGIVPAAAPPPVSAASTPAPPPASATPAATAAPADPAVMPPPAASEASLSLAPPPAARRAVAPAAVRSPTKRAGASPTAQASSPAPATDRARVSTAAQCAVPYTVDAQGSTHFIVECLNR
jgi:serine/threonine-protein kinase